MFYVFCQQPSKLVDAVKAMSDFEAELTLKESQLNSLRIDASDAEIVGHLKGRMLQFTKLVQITKSAKKF